MGQAIGQVGQGMDPNGTFGAPGGLDQYPVGPDYPQPGQAPGMGGKGPSGPPTGGMDPRPVGPGYPQPGQGPFQTRPMPAPAVYGRNAVVNPRARVTAQPVQSMKRGAGRGGLLR